LDDGFQWKKPLYFFHRLDKGDLTDETEMEYQMNLTERTKEVFKMYAEDAGNWNGNPPIGGNVGGSKEDRGNITQLKQAGLITTDTDEGISWIRFTKAGREYAATMGITI